MIKIISISLVWFSLLVMPRIEAQGLADCGSIENAYGPFDYTNPDHYANFLPRVEKHHFDADIESLRIESPADIDYTLRAFPNHHRALHSMLRYYLDRVSRGAKRMRYTAECYFDRARRMAPNDSTVVMLEGIYLKKAGRTDDAVIRFEAAVSMDPDSAELHYNAGLLYADLERYDLAVQHAKRAYELGFPLPGLRRKLQRAGVWSDTSTENGY